MLSNSLDVKKNLITIRSVLLTGGISAWLQILITLGMMVIYPVLGPKLETVQDYFSSYASSPMEMFLRGDFVIMVMVALYLLTAPALFLALKDIEPFWVGLAAAGSLISALLAIVGDSTFSMMHLAEQYQYAVGDSASQLLAAGQAVLSRDIWNSSAAYVSGFLLQGGGVVLSIVMLRSKDFSKVTAVTGLLANALDLSQHILHPFIPSILATFTPIMGIFYLVWFPMLGWDLIKNYRRLGAQK